ncbi:hypothetical protein AB1Y20_000220 [Prymnesium parvum]|uniref:Adaptor protein ClpS core domain-containing protein n=1 Tax=Prymnesium parvum TaxID=97485 RepID=A0AB34K4Q7_PRYPA
MPTRLSLAVLVLFSAGSAALQLGGLHASMTIVPVRPVPTMQMAPAPLKTRTKQTFSTSDGGKGGGKSGGAAQVAKPKRKSHTEDVPMWKVIMLGDEEYEEDPVCEVLLQVIPEIGNLRQAQEKYREAELTGKSMLLVVPKEHAESYVEQLIRADPMVYAEIEEE